MRNIMKLVYEKTGIAVDIDDICTLRDGIKVKVSGIQKPHKPASTGRVFVDIIPEDRDDYGIGTMSYFPSVIGAKWIEREDQ